MLKSAVISEGGLYRYQLGRVWDTTLPVVTFIMLNPSTADSETDDPTIRRVINFAKSWGYGGVFVGNLYAFRSTDPKGLKSTTNPVGDDNITHIKAIIDKSAQVIYAWGNNQKEPEWLRELVEAPHCIDVSTKGIPKHPLYLKGELRPKLYLRE